MSGKSIRAISKCLKIPKSTVHNQILCYKNSDDVKSALQSGRPKSLDDDDKKIFKMNLLKLVAKKLAQELFVEVCMNLGFFKDCCC